MAGKKQVDDDAPRIEPLPIERLNDAALYGIAGAVVRMLAPCSESDEASLLLQFLTLAGNMIGRKARKMVDASRHGANLYALIVGKTSQARKGSGYAGVIDVVKTVDATGWATRSGLASGEGVIYHLRDATTKDPGVADKRAMFVEQEFARLLTVADRKGNILSSILRLGFDTGQLDNLVKNSPDRATDVHMSVIGHITPQELRELLTNVYIADGFANRFILCLACRTKIIPNPIAPPTATLKAVLERLVEAVNLAAQIGEMQFSAEGLFYWQLIYGRLSLPNRTGLVAALLARAEAKVLRLAIVYALLDGKKEIGQEHLKASCAVWEYSERSAYFIFKDAIGQSDADVILTALRDAGDAGLNETQINGLFAGGRTALALTQARQLLLENRLAAVTVEEKGKGSLGGPRVKRWRATSKTSGIVESRYL